MRKNLLALTLATSVVLSTFVPITAQAAEAEPHTVPEPTLSAGLSSDPEAAAGEDSEDQLMSSLSSEGEATALIGGVVVLAAVVGLAGAGVTWAVQQRLIPNPLPGIIPAPAPAPSNQVYYSNCAAVWNALGGPIHRGQPGYRSTHDQDGDGVGCERDPR